MRWGMFLFVQKRVCHKSEAAVSFLAHETPVTRLFCHISCELNEIGSQKPLFSWVASIFAGGSASAVLRYLS